MQVLHESCDCARARVGPWAGAGREVSEGEGGGGRGKKGGKGGESEEERWEGGEVEVAFLPPTAELKRQMAAEPPRNVSVRPHPPAANREPPTANRQPRGEAFAALAPAEPHPRPHRHPRARARARARKRTPRRPPRRPRKPTPRRPRTPTAATTPRLRSAWRRRRGASRAGSTVGS